MTPKTREELAAAIEKSLRVADNLGLTDVGIKLNDAIVALDGDGVLPPAQMNRTGSPTRH